MTAPRSAPLLDQMSDLLASFTGDGTYDQENVPAAVAERHPEAALIVPPRSTAVPSETAATAPPLVFQRLRRRNLCQLRPRSGTTTSSTLPSTDKRPGRKPPGTRGGPEPKLPSAGSSR